MHGRPRLHLRFAVRPQEREFFCLSFFVQAWRGVICTVGGVEVLCINIATNLSVYEVEHWRHGDMVEEAVRGRLERDGSI